MEVLCDIFMFILLIYIINNKYVVLNTNHSLTYLLYQLDHSSIPYYFLSKNLSVLTSQLPKTKKTLLSQIFHIT